MTNIELTTFSAVKSAALKYANSPIDWEQRRYEISKEILAAKLSNPNGTSIDQKVVVKSCVELADMLIECLRN